MYFGWNTTVLSIVAFKTSSKLQLSTLASEYLDVLMNHGEPVYPEILEYPLEPKYPWAPEYPFAPVYIGAPFSNFSKFLVFCYISTFKSGSVSSSSVVVDFLHTFLVLVFNEELSTIRFRSILRKTRQVIDHENDN